ncbi:MAG TPA: hypothetical protein VNA12_00610, partial [Mycobacteriales bacterium]|nr:hypothetical protein [Mycobacteriales bacterium]
MGVHGQLALAGLRSRWRASLLLLCCLTVAATTLALGLVLRDQADRPWERAFDRANGAHVVVSAGDAGLLRRLATDPRVAAATEPRAETFGTLRVDGRPLLARLVAAPETSETVDRPLLIDGTAASSGGVVVEATLARALGLRVGDPVAVARAAAGDGLLPTVGDGPGTPLSVAGIAVVTSQAPVPNTQPGLVLIDRADLARVTAG